METAIADFRSGSVNALNGRNAAARMTSRLLSSTRRLDELRQDRLSDDGRARCSVRRQRVRTQLAAARLTLAG
jgi:hypothetical protein